MESLSTHRVSSEPVRQVHKTHLLSHLSLQSTYDRCCSAMHLQVWQCKLKAAGYVYSSGFFSKLSEIERCKTRDIANWVQEMEKNQSPLEISFPSCPVPLAAGC